MRNHLAFEISRRMGMEFTPFSYPVDVVLNGEFKGCYQLSDQVEAKEGRIPVTEMEETDISGEALTGGYHFEIDAYANEEPEGTWFVTDKYRLPVTVKSPDDGGTPEQFAYISDYLNKLADIVSNPRTFANPTTGYRSMLDLDSYLRYFICQEIYGNADAVWSVHMYKERGEDHIKAGPVWDLELAFDNDNRVYPSSSIPQLITITGRGPIAGDLLNFHKRIFVIDTYAARRRNEIYSIARNENDLNSESLCAYIDSLAAEMEESARLNFLRWDVLGKHIFSNPRAERSFEEAVNNLKTYITDRFDFLDKEEYLNYNPEISSVDNIFAQDGAKLSEVMAVDGRCITLPDGMRYRVITPDGRTCFDGTGTSPELSTGIYVVTCGSEANKVRIN